MDSDNGDILDWDSYLRSCKKSFQDKLSNIPLSKDPSHKFSVVQELSKGAFGTVLMAKSPGRTSCYAVKVMKKSHIVELKQVERIINEKKLLYALDFPFLVNTERFFKDNSYIYVLLPFVNGGDLSTYVYKNGALSEREVVFYAAQVVLALEYLHFMGVVYRDLKPENILLDVSGFIKLTDFGFSKLLSGWTYTFCGTPEYIAPEVLRGKGYSYSVDWWSLGVFIFELCAGNPPFYHVYEMKMFESIMEENYEMVESFSYSLKDLIKNLLRVDVSSRLGCGATGALSIKLHTWFDSIVWLDVLNKKTTPPKRPEVSGADDTSNFIKEEETFSFDISPNEEFPDLFRDF